MKSGEPKITLLLLLLLMDSIPAMDEVLCVMPGAKAVVDCIIAVAKRARAAAAAAILFIVVIIFLVFVWEENVVFL